MKHQRSRLRKPSPSMIVAITALCVSLVGTAVAAPIAVISLSKKDKKQVRKIAGKVSNKRITKRAPGLSVASAQSANTANTANSANTANTANSANTANTANFATVGLPRAYANVDFDGEVEPAPYTVGIPNATTPVEGTYCFDLAFKPVHAQATGEADGEGNDMASVAIDGVGGGLTNCPAGTDVEVEMWDTGLDEETEEEFFLAVW